MFAGVEVTQQHVLDKCTCCTVNNFCRGAITCSLKSILFPRGHREPVEKHVTFRCDMRGGEGRRADTHTEIEIDHVQETTRWPEEAEACRVEGWQLPGVAVREKKARRDATRSGGVCRSKRERRDSLAKQQREGGGGRKRRRTAAEKVKEEEKVGKKRLVKA